jgi:hypothetical protein
VRQLGQIPKFISPAGFGLVAQVDWRHHAQTNACDFFLTSRGGIESFTIGEQITRTVSEMPHKNDFYDDFLPP